MFLLKYTYYADDNLISINLPTTLQQNHTKTRREAQTFSFYNSDINSFIQKLFMLNLWGSKDYAKHRGFNSK